MAPSPDEGSDPVQHSWPDFTCYGCGPANDDGLQLESYVGEDGETLVATVDPDERFNAGAPDVMYGGLVASLLDCHSVWAAITAAYRADGRPLGSRPRVAYVTARLSVDYERPTPLDRPIHLEAWVDGEVGETTTVRSRLGPEGRTTATGEVVAVRVDPSDAMDHHRATGGSSG